MTLVIDRFRSRGYTTIMLRGPLRLFLSAALFWTGMNVCLMPQSECEGKAKAPCHCHHGSQSKCCTGIHLTEAGVQSGVSIAVPAPAQAVLVQSGPEAPAPVGWSGSPILSVQAVPPHPPPRECSGRSPPLV
jgi:hypothetical protein